MPIKKKKVAYLFGTGASHAEASIIDDTVSFLMPAIQDDIYKKIVKDNLIELRDVRNELARSNVDVEQLITLYESSGNRVHISVAKRLKKYFREAILKRVKQLDDKIEGGTYQPLLYAALIDMHQIKDFDEQLTGIMTLNYEDLIERSMQQVLGGVNYSLHFASARKSFIKKKNSGISIFKLHGSFNWKNEFPISIVDRIDDEEDVLWIPPGVEKQRGNYPFNIIWGKANELLDCDMLRIIGCSLSRNDWHLVSLLNATQKLNITREEYTVEVINSTRTVDSIDEKYPHLHIITIEKIKEIREFVYSSLFKLSDPKDPSSLQDSTIIEYLENKNIFDLWLRSKGEAISAQGINIKTPTMIFHDYMYKG